MKYYSITLFVLAIIFTSNIATGENFTAIPSVHYLGTGIDMAISSEESSASMVLDLGPDISFCDGDSATLDATTAGSTYLWNDGSTLSTLTVTDAGTYWVTVNTGGNLETDSIEVTVNNVSNFSFGADIVACANEIIVLSGFTPGATYLWQNGNTNSWLNITQAGTYSLQVDLNGCLHSDTVNISFVPAIDVDLGPDQNICLGDQVNLDAFINDPTVDYTWQDGSTLSTFNVTQTGSYYVTLDNGVCIATDTIDIFVNSTSSINLGPDTAICIGESILLDATTTGATYSWQDGSTGSTFITGQAGWYWVTISIGTCSGTDSILISQTPTPAINLGSNLIICAGDSTELDASYPGANYLWNDGSTNSTLWASQTGTFTVTVDLNGCTFTDSIQILVENYSTFNFGGPDTTLCQGETLVLSGLTPGATYSWQDGSTNSFLNITQSGQYYLEVNLNGCISSDTIQVNFTPTPIINLGPNLFICQGDSVLLDAFYSGATYSWNTGSTSSSIYATQTGLYSVDLNFNGCTYSDSIQINVGDISNFSLGNDTTLCQGELLTLSGFTPGATYVWQDGSTNSTLNVTQTGIYSLTVDLNNCSTSDTINITFDPSPIIDLGPDQFICQGDSILLDAFFLSATYLWDNGSTNSSIYVNQSGIYYVDLNSNGCTFSDTIEITVGTVSNFNLGNDTTLCQGESLVLSGLTPGATYLWQDGSTNSSLNVTQSGAYSLTVDLAGCNASDTIIVTFDPSPIISLGPDQFICQGDSILLDAFFQGATYSWDNGSTNSSIYVNQSGIYYVDLDLNGCTFSDTIEITVGNVSNFNFGNDTSLCQGETLVLSGLTPGATYLWQDGSTNSFLNITQSGVYSLTVDLAGCITMDTIIVTFDPSPTISLGPDQFICQGDSVSLSAFYSGASYLWQDGSTNSSLVAYQSGLYFVDLDLNGCSFSDSIQITVGSVSNFSLGNDTSICQGETITLSGASPGATYLWQNGSTASSFLVSQTGLYILEVDLNGCISTDSISVTVQPSPIISLGPDQQICQGDSTELNAFFPGATYTWQDGSTNAIFWASQTGTYSVIVNLNGCTFSEQINIVVNNYPIVNIGNDTAICETESIILNAGNPGATYQWQDGSTNSTLTAMQSGTYYVLVNNNGCVSSDTMNLTVKPTPMIDLGMDLSTCEGEQIVLDATYPGATYSWNTGSSNSIIYVQDEGLYTVDISLNGCDYQESIYLTFYPIPEINLLDSVEICAGEVYPIDASYTDPNTNYIWQDGSTNAIFNAVNEGWNIVTVESKGCEFTDSLYLTVHPLPNTSLTDTSICLGEDFLFNAFTFDALAYEWQDGSTDPAFLASEEGWYYVDIYNQHCLVRDSAFLHINTVPLVGLPEDTFLCEGTPLEFDFDENNATYLWQDGSTSNFYSIDELGIYSLTISNSCGTADFSMKVYPRDCECSLYIPNAFSPGNGGINEYLSPYSDCDLFTYHLKIFSRWGKLVFESRDPNDNWDGRIDGIELPQDVYIYHIKYTFSEESTLHNDQGTITLLR